MIIGVPKEIKLQEHRIGLTPDSAKVLVDKGHEILVQSNGGFEAGFTDEDYKNSGAKIIDNAEEIFKKAKEMSPYFQDGLHSLKDLDVVTGIRGYGMMGGIDIKMKDKPGKAGFQTFKHFYNAGVNFKSTGDTLIIAPQFICEKKHIDEIIEKLRTGISNYAKS